MKPRLSNRRNQAMDIVDLLVIIAVVAILAVMFVLSENRNRFRSAPRINCVSNLKQIAMAMRNCEDDYGKFPMSVSVTNGGVMELIATGNVAACFQVMSNKVSSAKILICPADASHLVASNFETLNNSNISYFINPDASETEPQMIMFGDDNLATNGVPVKSGLLEYTSRTSLSWTAARHGYIVNIAFADGSVAAESNYSMTNWPGSADFTNRLAIP